jgi:hypothetical protein
MADQLPETPYECASKEECNKEWVERQKLLVSLPRSKPEQSIFALVAERVAELREMQEDVLLLLAAEDLKAQKATLVQHLRGLGAKTAKLFKVSTIAAKEGSSTVQRLFIPAPAYSDLNDKESRALEKIRKEQEAAKKKESAKSESSRKMFNAKKATPYGYNYGKPSYSGSFSSGSGGLGSWALQQLLSQQLNQGASGSGKQKNCGGGVSAAAGSSGVQVGNYTPGWQPTADSTCATAAACWGTGSGTVSVTQPTLQSTSRARWRSRQRRTKRKKAKTQA